MVIPIYSGYRLIKKNLAVRKWKQTTGKILVSEVIQYQYRSDSRGIPLPQTHYLPKIEYSYIVKNKEYTGNNIFFVDEIVGQPQTPGFRNFRENSEKFVNELSLGKNIDVYYAPDNPKDSFLKHRPMSHGFGFIGVGLAFGWLFTLLIKISFF